MKVLHVIPAVAARYGGPSAAVLGLCRALDAAGVETLIATTDADGGRRLPLPLGGPVRYEGTQVIAFRRRASESLKLSPDLAVWVRAHVADFDVVHIHGVLSHACITAARAATAAKVPYLIAPLGTLDPVSLAQKPYRKALALRGWGRQAVRRAAAVQCTAPGEMQAIASKFPDARPVLIPLGVADDAFVASAARERLVMCVTRLAPHKGLERLLDAFDAAVTSGPGRDWRLVVAGDGDAAYVAGLRAQAARLSAASQISFPGWIDPAARRSWLARASLFALPSHHENFGLAVLEALAASVPVIVTEAVQLSHWIAPADAGWVAPGADASFDAMLAAAIEDTDDRQRRAGAARRLAEQFRWPAIATMTAACYGQMLVAAAAPAGQPLPAN